MCARPSSDAAATNKSTGELHNRVCSIDTVESALVALLHVARNSKSEAKSRKYVAKILWLLTYDNEWRQLFSAFDAYASLVSAANWLNWIPQLITLLIRNDETGKYVTRHPNAKKQVLCLPSHRQPSIGKATCIQAKRLPANKQGTCG